MTSLDEYAVIIKKSYSDGVGYDSVVVYYETIVYYNSLTELQDYLTENAQKQWSKDIIVNVIRYQKLNVRTEVVIELG